MPERAGVPERAGPLLRVLPPAGWVRRAARTAGGGIGGPGGAHLLERHMRVYRHVWLLLISGIAEPLFYLLSLGVGLGPLVGHVTGPGGAAVPYRELAPQSQRTESLVFAAPRKVRLGERPPDRIPRARFR